jgi:hypothetical protein
MADEIPREKYTVKVKGFDLDFKVSGEDLEIAKDEGKKYTAEFEATLTRRLQDNEDEAFRRWFAETMAPPAEPYKFPSITVIDMGYAVEHINAWFGQHNRVETAEEVRVDVDIHSDERRFWLVNARSGGWISDDEVRFMWVVDTLPPFGNHCLTGETDGNPA